MAWDRRWLARLRRSEARSGSPGTAPGTQGRSGSAVASMPLVVLPSGWTGPGRRRGVFGKGPLEPLRGNVVDSFLDTLTVLPPRGGTGRTVTPSGALRVDGDTMWGVSVSSSGEFHMSVIGTGWIGGSGARVFLGARGEPR